MKSLIYFFVVLFLISHQAFANDSEPAPGRIRVEVPDGFFDFPLEVYGAIISVENSEIKLDTALYLDFKHDDYRSIKEIRKIPIEHLAEMQKGLKEKLKLSLPQDFIQLIKKYNVYKIERTVKTFSPLDTIPHPFVRRDGQTIYERRANYNKYLMIYFDEKFDPKVVAEEFLKLPYIKFSMPEYPIEYYADPNDEAYQYGYQDYLDYYMMNFEIAWNYIKGENALVPITIAFIDGDFTNCNTHPDLAGNLNPNGPGVYSAGGIVGHGISVTSVACAVTNNNSLMAGATWNCKFMPFAAYYPSQVIAALNDIRDKLHNANYNDNCLVVNMSIGTTPSPELQDICNELYTDWVLLVAAVGKDGTSQVVYPANYSSVIGVGASNGGDDALFPTSNWGNDVELVATGDNIQVLRHNNFYVYEPEYGTSVAAPFVSSLCALILSTEQGFLMHPDQIRSRMKSTADYIYDFNHNKGFWRINAGNAIFNVITGIEDEIGVKGPSLLYQNQNYEFTGEFYDYPPYGNYIIGPWSWNLEGRLTNGNEILSSGQTYGSFSTIWDCTVPTIDIYRNWVRDINGHILAFIHASAQDNDSYWHSDNYAVSIDVQPFAPQNLMASLQPGPGYQYFFPRLNWTPNSEPDMKDYLIYRMVVNNGQVFDRWHQIATTTYSSFTDENMPVLPAGTYDLYYKIRARDDANQLSGYSNQAVIYGVEIFPQKGIFITNVSLVPRKMELLPNFPNPFNLETKIKFGLPEEERIELSIYSITGKKIVTLLNKQLESGYHTIVWDSKDENSKTVASGLYIYELLAGEKRLSGKMFLMK